jgi:hypothetical protein
MNEQTSPAAKNTAKPSRMDLAMAHLAQVFKEEHRERTKDFERRMIEKEDELNDINRKYSQVSREAKEYKERTMALEADNEALQSKLRETMIRYNALKSNASQLEAFRKVRFIL